MIKLFSIVVTFNGANWIHKCLKSLCESSMQSEIVVVDNCSSDDTVSIVNSHFPSVTLIKQDENLGFGQANNVGIRLAVEQGANAVFLLNQDAWVDRNTLSNLCDNLAPESEYGVLSPLHMDGSGRQLDNSFRRYLSATMLIDDLIIRNCSFKQVYDIPYVNAAAWLISSKCLENVGGFDPVFFHYGEDVDYVNRLTYHGYKIGVIPNSIVYHDRSSRSTALRAEQIVNRKVTNKLIDMKNILKNDKEAVPNLVYLRIDYCFDQFKNLIIGLVKKKQISDFWINNMVHKEIVKKLKRVKNSRVICKRLGPSFLKA